MRHATYEEPRPKFGTTRRANGTNTKYPGEYNDRNEPIGTRHDGPVAPNLAKMQAGETTPALTALKAAQAAPVGRVAPKVAASNVGSRTGQPLPVPVGGVAPAESGPAGPVGSTSNESPRFAGPLPSNPDDLALLMATRARDQSARTTAPIPLPPGDPEARAFFNKKSTPDAGAPVRPSPAIDPGITGIAGTGEIAQTPYGPVSSRLPSPGEFLAKAKTSSTGITRYPMSAASDRWGTDWQHKIVADHPEVGQEGTPENKAFVAAMKSNPTANPWTVAQSVYGGSTGHPSPALAAKPTGPSEFDEAGAGAAPGAPAPTFTPPTPAAPPVSRADSAVPVATRSWPADIPVATSYKQMGPPPEAGWRNPFSFGKPSTPVTPDFPAPWLPGGRPGGTGGMKSDVPDFPAPGLPGGRPGGTGGVTAPLAGAGSLPAAPKTSFNWQTDQSKGVASNPMDAWKKPKKPAQMMDVPADQYS